MDPFNTVSPYYLMSFSVGAYGTGLYVLTATPETASSWSFYSSAITGKGGATGPLKYFLQSGNV